VDRAIQAFFRRVKAGETPGYPRFQGRERYCSFTYPQVGHHGNARLAPAQACIVNPALKPPVTRLVRRIPLGQVNPLRSNPQNPQDAIEHIPAVAPRASSPVSAARRLPDQGLHASPLRSRQIHPLAHP
jgi:hypothetical protein